MKFARNLTVNLHLSGTVFESYLGCWGCLLAVIVLIYLETSSPQRVNNVLKLPGVLRCCKKLGSNDVKTQGRVVRKPVNVNPGLDVK